METKTKPTEKILPVNNEKISSETAVKKVTSEAVMEVEPEITKMVTTENVENTLTETKEMVITETEETVLAEETSLAETIEISVMEANSCADSNGVLPSCAPLANPYVPFQQNGAAKYEANKGIVRGTLFPGLDLPFMNWVNTEELSNTPLHELMALDFAIKELSLYLDTHSSDRDAFELFQTYTALSKAGRLKYIELYGPIEVSDLCAAEEYTWIKSPWPWEYTEGTAN